MHPGRQWFPILFILVPGLLWIMAANPRVAHGEQLRSPSDQSTCVKCHEDLYFLHDTGKWFCLDDAPMSCVDCHGGDPTALVKDQAHANRSAHPILNENDEKCMECHPDQSQERVRIFKKVAGVSPVIISEPYVPSVGSNTTGMPEDWNKNPDNDRIWVQITLSLLVIALAILWIRKSNRGRAG